MTWEVIFSFNRFFFLFLIMSQHYQVIILYSKIVTDRSNGDLGDLDDLKLVTFSPMYRLALDDFVLFYVIS